MTRLFDNGLVERTQTTYNVEPERADELQQRLARCNGTPVRGSTYRRVRGTGVGG